MVMKPHVLSLLTIFLLLALVTSTASAFGYQNRHCSGPYFSSYPPPGLRHERSPYFSYFYPIYYRMSYASDYRSPSAGRVSTPKPLLVKNPFVQADLGKNPYDMPPKVKPLRIKNPYVDSKPDSK